MSEGKRAGEPSDSGRSPPPMNTGASPASREDVPSPSPPKKSQAGSSKNLEAMNDEQGERSPQDEKRFQGFNRPTGEAHARAFCFIVRSFDHKPSVPDAGQRRPRAPDVSCHCAMTHSQPGKLGPLLEKGVLWPS
ncbi:hypothetical protein EVAR_50994_1 [Eumeta japonica]|uniref:Uncharacterized protein n=1 Tax=Eumeta variegata TaxID=151549 RepID=A0A4C1ZXU2_EUMVA|nr:hypothetical protein EVAR_50994_1 [Eumeta japonica]